MITLVVFLFCCMSFYAVSGENVTDVATPEHASTPIADTDLNVDGGWGDWEPWSSYSPCPVNCGTGYIKRSRQRKCDNPPVSHNGSDCIGLALEITLTTCASHKCPVGKGKSHFGTIFRWSPCLPECGFGFKIRAKGHCIPKHKGSCLRRKLDWEVRRCFTYCKGLPLKELLLQKRKIGVSVSVTKQGSETSWEVTVHTPKGDFSGGLSHDKKGKVTGGTIGYSKGFNVGVAEASVGGKLSYHKDKGLTASGHASAKVGHIEAGVSGGYNFKDKTVSTSASLGLSLKSSSKSRRKSNTRVPKSKSRNYRRPRSKSSGRSRSLPRSRKLRSTRSRKVRASRRRRRRRRRRRGKRSESEHQMIDIEDKICEIMGENLMAHPTNCKAYISCHQGVAYFETCRDEMAWNKNEKRCDPPNPGSDCFE